MYRQQLSFGVVGIGVLFGIIALSLLKPVEGLRNQGLAVKSYPVPDISASSVGLSSVLKPKDSQTIFLEHTATGNLYIIFPDGKEFKFSKTQLAGDLDVRTFCIVLERKYHREGLKDE